MAAFFSADAARYAAFRVTHRAAFTAAEASRPASIHASCHNHRPQLREFIHEVFYVSTVRVRARSVTRTSTVPERAGDILPVIMDLPARLLIKARPCPSELGIEARARRVKSVA